MALGEEDNTQDDLTLSLLDNYPQVLAPTLSEHLQYHAFLMYTPTDSDWVENVVEKLESSTLGFKCCCQHRNIASTLSAPQAVLYGMKSSLKTVIALTPEFVRSCWPHCEGILQDMDFVTLQRDVVVLMLRECDLPSCLTHIGYIKAFRHGWWTKFLARLALPDDTPMTEETVLSMSCSMSSSLVGLTPGLQSGHLLSSLKSQCGCFGREFVDTTQVPDELLAHGVQIPPDEYCDAVQELMREFKFRCHVWCYNLPVVMTFFSVLLAMCLLVTPLVEARLPIGKLQVGMEYLHGTVLWLCCLTFYMFTNHCARRRMKQMMYKRLARTNTVFIKYNILLGVENLGVADCNKYYAYLQEILGSLESQRSFTNHLADDDVTTITMEVEDGMDTCDQITVLNGDPITNSAMQTEAEDMLLEHSGEYIYRLITKKLDRPHKQRHVTGSFCLCQYIEFKVFKLVV